MKGDGDGVGDGDADGGGDGDGDGDGHLRKPSRGPEEIRFFGECARASRRALGVFLVWLAASLPAFALRAPARQLTFMDSCQRPAPVGSGLSTVACEYLSLPRDFKFLGRGRQSWFPRLKLKRCPPISVAHLWCLPSCASAHAPALVLDLVPHLGPSSQSKSWGPAPR